MGSGLCTDEQVEILEIPSTPRDQTKNATIMQFLKIHGSEHMLVAGKGVFPGVNLKNLGISSAAYERLLPETFSVILQRSLFNFAMGTLNPVNIDSLAIYSQVINVLGYFAELDGTGLRSICERRDHERRYSCLGLDPMDWMECADVNRYVMLFKIMNYTVYNHRWLDAIYTDSTDDLTILATCLLSHPYIHATRLCRANGIVYGERDYGTFSLTGDEWDSVLQGDPHGTTILARICRIVEKVNQIVFPLSIQRRIAVLETFGKLMKYTNFELENIDRKLRHQYLCQLDIPIGAWEACYVGDFSELLAKYIHARHSWINYDVCPTPLQARQKKLVRLITEFPPQHVRQLCAGNGTLQDINFTALSFTPQINSWNDFLAGEKDSSDETILAKIVARASSDLPKEIDKELYKRQEVLRSIGKVRDYNSSNTIDVHCDEDTTSQNNTVLRSASPNSTKTANIKRFDSSAAFSTSDGFEISTDMGNTSWIGKVSTTN